jgi:hypothetical protein
MNLRWPAKRPSEILDYTVDWSNSLRGETIRQCVFDVPPGLVKLSESAQERTTRLWLAGGVDGACYTISNRIRTNSGRSLEQSIDLPIVDD